MCSKSALSIIKLMLFSFTFRHLESSCHHFANLNVKHNKEVESDISDNPTLIYKIYKKKCIVLIFVLQLYDYKNLGLIFINIYINFQIGAQPMTYDHPLFAN